MSNSVASKKKPTDIPVWRAFYVKPRHEKAVRDRYLNTAFEIFCPTVTEKKKWHDRWKAVEKPVLPGYILAHITEAQRFYLLREDDSILNSVTYLGKPAVIRDEEVELLKTYLAHAIEVQAEPLKPGMRITITDGPLAGKDGDVEMVAGKDVFIILETLQVQLRIKVAAESVKKITEGEQAR